VLFPHDVLHAGLEVTNGVKYVVRTELMFRCVDRGPTPPPNVVADSQFQRMATLYEQVGDLVLKGDASATTKVYQEALGLQIAFHGTSVPAPTWVPLAQPLVFALQFLSPGELLSSASVCHTWCEGTRLGSLWRLHFQRRWPGSCEVLDDVAFQLDPELKDWLGSYKRAHVMQSFAPTCILFISNMVQAKTMGNASIESVPAVLRHLRHGIGWDSSLKQRVNWIHSPRGEGISWYQDGVVEWNVLPEIFNLSFRWLQLREDQHRVLLTTYPGVWTKCVCERASRILRGRFRVPSVCCVPAPFCALLAHGLTSGTVVWGCSLGWSSVICYEDYQEVASAGRFDFQTASAHDIATLLSDAEIVSQATKCGHVIFVCHGSDDAPVTGDWLEVDAVRSCLQDTVWGQTKFHRSHPDDVLLGAEALVLAPDRLASFEVGEIVKNWEWRQFVDDEWVPLPPYVAGVFEGALQDCEPYAFVQNCHERKYVVADLENFRMTIGVPNRRSPRTKDHFTFIYPWRSLTRFVRGRPSPNPDRRTADMDVNVAGVEEVVDVDAITVRSLAGDLVFAMSCTEARSLVVADVLEAVSATMCTPSQKLCLLLDERTLEPSEALRPLFHGGVDVEMLVFIDETRDVAETPFREQIPEDLPGRLLDFNLSVLR